MRLGTHQIMIRRCGQNVDAITPGEEVVGKFEQTTGFEAD
jgi:hypothetical protein